MPRHRQPKREWRLGDVLMLILLGLLYLFLVMLVLALLDSSSPGTSIAKPEAIPFWFVQPIVALGWRTAALGGAGEWRIKARGTGTSGIIGDNGCIRRTIGCSGKGLPGPDGLEAEAIPLSPAR